MAFVVEDGTGKSDATSYVALAYFKDYAGQRGLNIVGWTDPQIQQDLNNGSLWIDMSNRGSFKGRKVLATQALQFPRSCLWEDNFAIMNNVIPVNLQKAVCEAAFVSHTTNLFGSIAGDAGKVLEKSVGPITVKYAQGVLAVSTYPVIEKFLAGLTYSSSGIIQTVRG